MSTTTSEPLPTDTGLREHQSGTSYSRKYTMVITQMINFVVHGYDKKYIKGSPIKANEV